MTSKLSGSLRQDWDNPIVWVPHTGIGLSSGLVATDRAGVVTGLGVLGRVEAATGLVATDRTVVVTGLGVTGRAEATTGLEVTGRLVKQKVLKSLTGLGQ